MSEFSQFVQGIHRFCATAEDRQVEERLSQVVALRDRLLPGDARDQCNLVIRILKGDLAARRDADSAVRRVFGV